MRAIDPVAVRPHHWRVVRLSKEIAAYIGKRRRIDADKREERRRKVGLPCRYRPWARQAQGLPVRRPDEEGDPIVQRPGDLIRINPDRSRQRFVAREPRIVIAEDDE